MSCLPIVSDRAATEGSKYFELGRQPHEFLTRNTCLVVRSIYNKWRLKWRKQMSAALRWVICRRQPASIVRIEEIEEIEE